MDKMKQDQVKTPEPTDRAEESELATPPCSVLRDTAEEIRQLRLTRDPIFERAADELEEAANYSFTQNAQGEARR